MHKLEFEIVVWSLLTVENEFLQIQNYMGEYYRKRPCSSDF